MSATAAQAEHYTRMAAEAAQEAVRDAAPDLLAALKLVYRCEVVLPETVERAVIAAIAKAEPRS